MFDNTIARQTGTIVHRLVRVAIEQDLGPDDVRGLAEAWWRENPVGGTTAWQTRTRAVLAANVYLRLLRPVGWDLLGAEQHLGSSVADLVWGLRTTAGEIVAVFVDELKTGRDPLTEPELIDQVARLERDASEQWPGVFAGVRVAETRHASRSRFWTSDGSRLLAAQGPDLGGEVRS
ncbi:hypothetical protein NHL50_09800 [Acidimicrobiia bacterium EGI L10123]|uniref:hypothetical protein n=1 Tax=Salinilacustrithrix flava TaxID=2957203 RepID=UPI003D7C211B|nr:hypothetical protein [Acidimicrobiia bacterium EGI L10123]